MKTCQSLRKSAQGVVKVVKAATFVLGAATFAPDGEAAPMEGPLNASQMEAQAVAASDTTGDAPWYFHSVSLYASKNISFAPTPIDDIYAEYEYFGRKGPLELYGYFDIPKVLGIGNSNDHGIWDGGSRLYMEHNPRLSLDGVSGRSLGFGPFKEFYVAADWLYDWGKTATTRSNILYVGLGTDLETLTPMTVGLNIYAKRVWENYGGLNENSWDGYRLQLKYFSPRLTFANGTALSFIGYIDYDFGSKLPQIGGNAFTGNYTVWANRLVYTIDRLRLSATAYYFHNSGNIRNGTVLDFGTGPFSARTTGWGWSLGIGYQF